MQSSLDIGDLVIYSPFRPAEVIPIEHTRRMGLVLDRKKSIEKKGEYKIKVKYMDIYGMALSSEPRWLVEHSFLGAVRKGKDYIIVKPNNPYSQGGE
tara:strand:- start:195 stop:485 length:291 start_codon:yes stop_codon:yes gene_type:complete